MAEQFSFKITHKDSHSKARAGIIHTAHGSIETPYLIPVATRSEIIALSQEDLAALKPQAILANTYHLHFMPPGDQEIKRLGGLHKKMNFSKPLFTDSGGFQALSLGFGKISKLRKIGFFPNQNPINLEKNENSFVKLTDKGIFFRSIYNEEIEEFMDAEKSMKIQSNLGADIIMAFDQCNPPGQTEEETKKAMEISHRWEIESLKYKDPQQALYGIVHGGAYPKLREQSANFIASLPFDGIAIGGSLGNTKSDMYSLLQGTIDNLKDVDHKPRHMLGIGWVDDLFECVSRGMDTFDCVQTTRIARHGNLLVSPISGGTKANKFKIKIRRGIHSSDKNPIDSWCSCSTCKKYSRSDIFNLHKSKDPLYAKLATIHNISFMIKLSEEIKNSIKENRFGELKKEWLNS